jgi:hypothetical protein
LYHWLIELERIFILPLAPRWFRHSYLSKRLHTIPYTCGISASDVAVVMALLFGRVDDEERAAGDPGVGDTSAMSAPRSRSGT